MANSWNVIDCYALVTEAYQQATGRKDIAAVDTTSFVAIGSILTQTQSMKETTLGVISQMVLRTIYNDRVTRRRLDILRADEERWGGVVRKLTVLPLDPEESESFNTDIAPNQLADGNSVDMFKIRKPKVIELNFWGQKILKTHITRFMYQFDAAFTSEAEMMRFVRSMMLQFYNDITRINDAKTRLVLLNAVGGIYKELNFWGQKILKTHITRFMYQFDAAFTSEAEMMRFVRSMMLQFYNDITRINDAKTRLVLLNAVGGIYKMGNAVDLAAGYNTEFSTNHSRNSLLTTYLEDFLKYVVSTVNIYSDNLEDSSALYHANLTGLPDILRETPKEYQRMLFYKPFFTKAKATVMPTIFNPDELRLGEYSTVNFWQDKKSPTEVKVKPTYLDVATGESVDSDEEVVFDYLLGILYDVEFMGVFPKFEYATTSPLNSNGLYWNEFVHWSFNNWTDYTENAVCFYIGAGGDDTPVENNG